jgi:hypothetical protein
MGEWQPIDQSALPPPARPRVVRLHLGPYGRGSGRSCLTLTVPTALHAPLGWAAGERVGLSVGYGRTAGWLRVLPDSAGRALRHAARGHALIVALIPPPEWRHLQAPSEPCEHRIQGNALLVQIPWDMDDIAVAAPTAEEAAA